MSLHRTGGIRGYLRKTGIMTTTVASCFALGAPVAHAAEPPAQSPRAAYNAYASDCLTNNADYDDTVASFTAGPINNAYLYCGDQTKGVLHIDRDHPFAENGDDDDDIVTCVENFGSYGSDLPPGEDPYNFVVEMPLDKDEDGSPDDTARIAYDKDTYNVTSLHTKQTSDHPQGNDWYGCANYPVG